MAAQVPVPQVWPHVPHEVGSVIRSTQPMPLPHLVWVAAQAHWPETHVPCPQVVLQLPQWAGSLVVS